MAARCSTFFLVGILTILSGCRTSRCVRDQEYAHVVQSVHRAWQSPSSAADALGPVSQGLEGPHPVEDYIRYALEQNPNIQAARKQMEASAYRVPIAAALPDPTLGLTAFPEPVQTAAGQQELSLAVSQKFPWRRKLSANAAAAEARTNMARAQLAAVELETVAAVKRAYYELYFIQQAIRVTREERRSLVEIREVANTRYRVAATSQQDVLRADLEISNVENELIRLRQRLESAQARLARLLHVGPQTRLRAADALAFAQAPGDLQWLQRRAVAARPELHAKLAALERDRQSVQLSRLDYLPDVTLGATWIDVAGTGISPVANGEDSVLITTGINVPIYRKRLTAGVRAAEATAVSTARQYDSLRDATLEQVMDLFARARSQEDLLTSFREDILPKARLTLDVSIRAYDSGDVDFLQLIDNWRQLLRYELSYHRLEASLRQTLADLERVVGGFMDLEAEAVDIPRSEPNA